MLYHYFRLQGVGSDLPILSNGVLSLHLSFVLLFLHSLEYLIFSVTNYINSCVTYWFASKHWFTPGAIPQTPTFVCTIHEVPFVAFVSCRHLKLCSIRCIDLPLSWVMQVAAVNYNARGFRAAPVTGRQAYSGRISVEVEARVTRVSRLITQLCAGGSIYITIGRGHWFPAVDEICNI